MKLIVGFVVALSMAVLSVAAQQRENTAPPALCSVSDATKCNAARAAMASIVDDLTACGVTVGCRIVPMPVGSCAQNPTSKWICGAAIRDDVQAETISDLMAGVAKAGQACLACQGTPCAAHDCAPTEQLRAVCNPDTHRCEMKQGQIAVARIKEE